MIYCQKCGKQIEKYIIIKRRNFDIKVCKDCAVGEKRVRVIRRLVNNHPLKVKR